MRIKEEQEQLDREEQIRLEEERQFNLTEEQKRLQRKELERLRKEHLPSAAVAVCLAVGGGGCYAQGGFPTREVTAKGCLPGGCISARGVSQYALGLTPPMSRMTHRQV